MMLDAETLTRWASQDEGQFSERKSAFDRLVQSDWLQPEGQKRGIRYVPAK